jgi:hypothetical protein
MNMGIKMKNYAVIKNNIVENVIVWDGIVEFSIDGELVEITESNPASIGFLYQDGQFIDPNPIVEEPVTQE